MDTEVLEYPRGGAPRRGRVRVSNLDAQGVSLVVDLLLVQDRDGAKNVKPWEVRSLRVERADDGPVNSTLIRRVPVTELLTQAIAAFGGERPKITVARRDELRDAGDRGLSDNTLTLVGKVYEEVALQQGNPVQEIVDAFGISRSTATRWIRRARDMGYISALESERLADAAAEQAQNLAQAQESGDRDATARAAEEVARTMAKVRRAREGEDFAEA